MSRKEITFCSNKKLVTHQGLLYGENGFVAEVNFRNVEERPTAKNYCPVYLLSLVSKAFEEFE